MSKLTVIKSETQPETTGIMVSAIISISNGFQKLMDGGLTEEVVIILLQHKTKVSMKDIRHVLHGIKMLKGWYCREKGDGKR